MTSDESIECNLMNIALKRLEREMRIPQGYLVSLREEDNDWDFIVKLGIILEAVLTRAIHLESQQTMTFDQVSRASQSWRIKTAMELKLISASEMQMLQRFSIIRNDFMHRFENMLRTLSDYFLEKGAAERKSIIKAFLSSGVPGNLKSFRDPQQRLQFIENFRQVTLRAIFPMLLNLGYSHDNKRREKEHLVWRENQEKLLGCPLPPRKSMYIEDRIMVQEILNQKRAADSET